MPKSESQTVCLPRSWFKTAREPSAGINEAFRHALGRALERLRHSDAFEYEIRALLQSRGTDEVTIASVVARLREQRLIDDSRVIQEVLQRRTGARARGVEALRAELLTRGAPEDEVDKHLGGITPEASQTQMLVLLSKKCKISDSRAKAARILLSRGFQEDEIGTALDAFFGASETWDSP